MRYYTKKVGFLPPHRYCGAVEVAGMTFISLDSWTKDELANEAAKNMAELLTSGIQKEHMEDVAKDYRWRRYER